MVLQGASEPVCWQEHPLWPQSPLLCSEGMPLACLPPGLRDPQRGCPTGEPGTPWTPLPVQDQQWPMLDFSPGWHQAPFPSGTLAWLSRAPGASCYHSGLQARPQPLAPAALPTADSSACGGCEQWWLQAGSGWQGATGEDGKGGMGQSKSTCAQLLSQSPAGAPLASQQSPETVMWNSDAFPREALR